MNKKLQVWLPLLLSLSMIVGMLLGYHMRDNMPGKKFFSLDKTQPLQEVIDLINNRYVDDVTGKALADTAIQAILDHLDPHSVYISPDQLEGINEEVAGKFYGIGVEFDFINDTFNVLNVLPDGPSAKAGIEPGDQFIKVNDSSFTGKEINSTRIRKILRGELGSAVKVALLRNGLPKTITIERGIIPLSSIDAAYMIDSSTGFIRLSRFTQATYREFMLSLEKLQKQGLKKLILDLRDNGGGVLDEATAIADEFLDGDKLITYTEGKHFPKKEYRCKKPGLFETGQLVVLTDEGSASASEILIGALQDWDRGTIIGRRSFGKGLVQEQYDLSDGSALRLTVARYYTPLGRSIQRPYQSGEKAYYNDIHNRLTNGEMTQLGNNAKADTGKVYQSPKGKKLYGGGGIQPDVHVPLDTQFIHTNMEIPMQFALSYFKTNRTALKAYPNAQAFNQQFQFSESDYLAIAASLKQSNPNLVWQDAATKKWVIQHFKAAIARMVWRNEGYFTVTNSSDQTIQVALQALK
ncbi:MAG: hypothetical protein RLY16_2613 [Bacteroidota bacterium]